MSRRRTSSLGLLSSLALLAGLFLSTGGSSAVTAKPTARADVPATDARVVNVGGDDQSLPAADPALISATAPLAAPSKWRTVFREDFNVNVPEGTFPGALAGRWDAYPSGWWDTSKKGIYSTRNLSVHDSVFDIHLRTVNGIPVVAAPYPLRQPQQTAIYQRYGRYAVRFKVPTPLPGYKVAWLLWPSSNRWPQDGEIDFPEGDLVAGGRPIGYMHRQGGTSWADQDVYPTNVRFDDGQWHTAVIEWEPNSCTFIMDGIVIGRSQQAVPATHMRYLLQTETALKGGPPPAWVDGHVLVDWLEISALN